MGGLVPPLFRCPCLVASLQAVGSHGNDRNPGSVSLPCWENHGNEIPFPMNKNAACKLNEFVPNSWCYFGHIKMLSEQIYNYVFCQSIEFIVACRIRAVLNLTIFSQQCIF